MPSDEPSELRKSLTIALVGVSIYGGGVFVWQLPVLMDDAIGASLNLSQTQMISTTTGTFFGWALGSAVFGLVADRVGRRPVALGGSAVVVFHLLVSASANRVGGLLAARILGGLALGGQLQGFPLALEHISEEQKASKATWLNLCFAVASGIIVTTHITCSRLEWNWRTELCAHALVLSVLLAATALVVPHSPVNQEVDMEMVPTIGEGGSDKVYEGLENTEPERHEHNRPASSALFGRAYGASNAIISFSFVAVSVVYYGLSYQAGELSESTELNVLFLAVLDLPGNKLFDLLAARPGLGVSGSLAILFGMCAIFLALLAVVAQGPFGGWTPPLAFMGKMFSAGAFQGVYLLPSELLPPFIQSSAFGFASSCARLVTAGVPSLVGMLPLSLSSLLVAVIAFAAALVVWAGRHPLFCND